MKKDIMIMVDKGSIDRAFILHNIRVWVAKPACILR